MERRFSDGALTMPNYTITQAQFDAMQAVLTAIGGAPAPPPSNNLLVNGSFESPSIATYQYSPIAPGWTFGTGGGIQRDGSAWDGAPAVDGVQTAFIQGASSLSQSVTLAAGSYTLTFYLAQRQWAMPPGAVQPIAVSLDGVQQGAPITPAATSFSQYNLALTGLGAGVHTITFAGTNPVGDASTFLDAVTLQ